MNKLYQTIKKNVKYLLTSPSLYYKAADSSIARIRKLILLRFVLSVFRTEQFPYAK